MAYTARSVHSCRLRALVRLWWAGGRGKSWRNEECGGGTERESELSTYQTLSTACVEVRGGIKATSSISFSITPLLAEAVRREGQRRKERGGRRRGRSGGTSCRGGENTRGERARENQEPRNPGRSG
jgi:hypothetical protein